MESSRPWESRGSAAGAPPQVSAVATPPAPAAQTLGEGLRRPCRGQTCGGMLGAMARIVAACPVIFSRCYAACACGTKTRRGPPAALPGADVWGHAWGDGAHCRLHYPCTAAEPFSNRNHSFRAALELSRIFYTAISFHRGELLRIENYRKPTRMSRSHSRSVKGPPCGAGLAPWYPGASQATAPQGGQ